MMPHPNIIVQLSTRSNVAAFREGIGDILGIVALGPETESSWRMAGIDAFYLSLTRAERWGSRPIPPHTVTVLRTKDLDLRAGYPPRIISGLLLREHDPNTAAFGIPLLVTAVLNAVTEVNSEVPGTIRTLGFFEFELTFKGSSLQEVGRLMAEAVNAFRKRT